MGVPKSIRRWTRHEMKLREEQLREEDACRAESRRQRREKVKFHSLIGECGKATFAFFFILGMCIFLFWLVRTNML